jgi:AcrR family transcriptional regulator
VPLVRATDHARQARERGEAALLAAVEQLVDEGTPYSELGVAQITDRAGFSRATFYAYFTDKRDLAMRLGARIQSALEDEVGSWLDSGEGEVREVLGRTLAVFAERRGAARTLVEASAYDPEIAALWRTIHARFEEGARGRVHASLPDLAPDAVAARAYVLVWGTQAALVEQISVAHVDQDALLDALTVQWEAALGTPAP